MLSYVIILTVAGAWVLIACALAVLLGALFEGARGPDADLTLYEPESPAALSALPNPRIPVEGTVRVR